MVIDGDVVCLLFVVANNSRWNRRSSLRSWLGWTNVLKIPFLCHILFLQYSALHLGKVLVTSLFVEKLAGHKGGGIEVFLENLDLAITLVLTEHEVVREGMYGV